MYAPLIVIHEIKQFRLRLIVTATSFILFRATDIRVVLEMRGGRLFAVQQADKLSSIEILHFIHKFFV